MTIQGLDFSTVFVPVVSAAGVASLFGQGYRHALIGLDSSAGSIAVRQAFVDGGFDTSAYRFVYGTEAIDPQIADVLAAIHAAPEPLPRWLVLDIEPIWNNDGSIAAPPPTIAQLEQAISLVEAGDVTPTSRVTPVIYSNAYIWNTWYAGYTGPASRGWGVIVADWGLPDGAIPPLFGGFTVAQLVGIQFQGSTATAIGDVDLDRFIDVPAPAPVPPQPAPGPDVPDAQAELNLLDQDIDNYSVALHARVQKTREDLNAPTGT